jgi:nicotinate-nucleotide--dimethylbenzimidazole phosphoribosyltransferase
MINYGKGGGGVNMFCRQHGFKLRIVDVGVDYDLSHIEGIIERKIARGTKNFLYEPAMTEEEFDKAIEVGAALVDDCIAEGCKVLSIGEMGIGNTTTSAAVSSVILGVGAERVTGRGAGLTDDGLKRKIGVINTALRINRPDRNNPLDILAKVGGLDIAGMTGLFLGGGIYHVPIVIDGVISAVSAALAYMISPACADYMLASHVSDEPAGKMLLDFIGLKAVINAGLRLGEGTGGILLLPLLDGAVSIYNDSHSFEELGIERYKKLS